ncbi:MAG: hypothetical protein OER80_12005 [Gammaproteobacteria bacterium]|nr:hypothetical protein [Gammaproteobacteria bacterium]MDH3767945.1 hypothetical protein [Gammaproteobacteria bacterium]
MINDSDRAFLESVEKCEWPGAFTHEDHIRLAWIYLQKHPTDEAIIRCGSTLRGFAESHGDFGKYHETLTVALTRLISSHVDETPPTETWEAFRDRVRPLFESARELIARHYSQERLSQSDARKIFVPPDRKPL